MNELYTPILLILVLALVVWALLVNDVYLKILNYFYSKKYKLSSVHNPKQESILSKFQSDESIPDYIKKSVEPCKDKYKLIFYYLSSKKNIDFKLFQEINKSNKINDFELYLKHIDYFKDDSIKIKKHSHDLFFGAIRVLALLFFIILTAIFLSSLFNQDIQSWFWNSKICKNKVMQTSENRLVQAIVLLFISVLVMMPYNLFFKSLFINKIFEMAVYWGYVLLAVLCSLFIYNVRECLVIEPFSVIFPLSVLFITLGASAYIGYAKFGYLKKFFELLKQK